MAFQYLESSNVHMFPSSMRSGTNDVYSRFTTELNLVNIVNRVSTGKFVSGTYTESGNLWVDFTLLGYHFETNISSIINSLSVDDKIYACAVVGYAVSNGTNVETRYDEILKGWLNNSIQTSVDADTNFIGLLFTTDVNDCTTLNTQVGQPPISNNWNCTCDYIELGAKKSGTTAFEINTAARPFDTQDIDSISDEDINNYWGS